MKTTWERFQSATLTLAQSGSIKERLNDAYRKHLSDLVIEDLPEPIREEFRALRGSLRRDPPETRSDDAVRATIRKMSVADANRAAASVVRMFAAIARPAGASRQSGPATVVPLFAAEGR